MSQAERLPPEPLVQQHGAMNATTNGNGNNGEFQNPQNGATPSTEPSVSRAEALKSPEEDEEIFSFFKKYVGLLTLVGSLPVLTAGIDVIAPPADAKKLSAISSLACIITLGICVLFKKGFASWSVSRNGWVRATGPLTGLLLLLCGIVLIGFYSQPTFGGPNASSVYRYGIYLLIFPCFVGALGVTLMASYSQFHGARLEAKIDQKILDADANQRLKDTIENYITILTASADKRIERFSNSLLRDLDVSLKKLNTGYVEVFGTKIEEMQKQLLEHFNESVHAVSDRDLAFWLNGFCEHIKSSDELIAKQYLRLNIDAVSKGTRVTRIFIFQDSDFNHNKAGIVSVLAKHQEAGIGWAVLIHEELPTHLKAAQQSFDFALLDGQCAVAVLSNYNLDNQRRLYVLLNVPGSLQARIKEYGGLHQQLVSQCWLASKPFCDVHVPECTITLEAAVKDNRERSHALNFGSGKIICIDREEQIADAIEFTRGLRRKNMLYWGEVSSSNVIDLAGDWTYSVKGKDLDGVEFEHQGTCQGVLEDGKAYFSGVRRLTIRRERSGPEQRVLHAAPWKSSPIDFGDEGKLGYSSTISIDGVEIKGLGEIRFLPDHRRLKGKIHMIMGDGQLISADVEFHRRVEATKPRSDEPGEFGTALALNRGSANGDTASLQQQTSNSPVHL